MFLSQNLNQIASDLDLSELDTWTDFFLGGSIHYLLEFYESLFIYTTSNEARVACVCMT